MYEMSCTGCGRRVSNQLIACPDCGTPVGYTGGTPVDRTQLRPTADPTQSASDKSTEGVQLREAGDYEAAVVICSEAIALAPNSAAYYRNRAQAHSRLGREDLALADAERAGAGRWLQANPFLGVLGLRPGIILRMRIKLERADIF